MFGQAGSDNGAYHRVTHRDGGQIGPEGVGRGIQAHIQGYKEEAERCERQRQRTHRPREPRSRVAAHPTASSTLFPCPFCHNTTLQHDRLPSVTATVTKPSGERTSENPQKAKFAEFLF